MHILLQLFLVQILIGGVYSNTSYYYVNKNSAVSNNTYSGNGWARDFSVNIWTNDFSWDGYSGFGSKYLKINFNTGNSYSKPVTKIRNLKIYGQMPNSFYLINVKTTGATISVRKYANGNQDISYFTSNGTTFSGNQIRVTENGIYTVYTKDNSGNENIKRIKITNIL